MLDKICRTRGHLYVRFFKFKNNKDGKPVQYNPTRHKTIGPYRQGMSCKPTGGKVVKLCKVVCTRCGTVSWQPDNFDRIDSKKQVLV